MVPTGQGFLPGVTDLAILLKASEPTERKTEEASTDYYALPSFRRALENRPEDAVQHPDTVRAELTQPKREPYRLLLRNFALKPDDWTQPELDPLGCDLPLWKTNPSLKMTDPSRPQPRYQMQLWLEAVDNDLDSDKTKDGRPRPHVRVSEERFTFLLVSENELLTEIAKEEEQLYANLDQRYQGLLETQNHLTQVNLDLTSSTLKVDELGPMSARTDQISEVLEKTQIAAREVYGDYARILREMKANQVSERFLDRVEKTIVEPLKNIDRNFDDTREAVANFRKALDSKDLAAPERIDASRKSGKDAKEQMLLLTRELEKILASMQKMTDINALIKIIAEIEKDESKQFQTVKEIYDKEIDKVFEQATGNEQPEKKKK
jgi:hypothetical protein